MKLVIIFGPHAVGKMTVGQELEAATGLKLFHNHMSIEIVTKIFENLPAEGNRINNLIRREIFEAYSKSDEYGIIFTYMWALDCKEDWDYVNWLEGLFASRGAQVYFVELEADKNLRLARNKTENRLLNKPSKRDLAASEQLFLHLESKYRFNSLAGEIQKANYIKINNGNLSPAEAAEKIQKAFLL